MLKNNQDELVTSLFRSHEYTIGCFMIMKSHVNSKVTVCLCGINKAANLEDDTHQLCHKENNTKGCGLKGGRGLYGRPKKKKATNFIFLH